MANAMTWFIGLITLISCVGLSAKGKRTAEEIPMLVLTKVRAPAQRVMFGESVLDIAARDCASLKLTNITTDEIRIDHALMQLDMFSPVIRDQRGEVISTNANFGITLSGPVGNRRTRIAPGKAMTYEIGLPFETVPSEKLKPGVYHFRVQFRYQGKLWESNEIDLHYEDMNR